MFSYDAYKMVDLPRFFEVAPSEGYLLQNLNIFDKSSRTAFMSCSIALLKIIKPSRTNRKNVTVLNTIRTARTPANSFPVELLHLHREDTVSAVDFQKAGRKPGTDVQEPCSISSRITPQTR